MALQNVSRSPILITNIKTFMFTHLRGIVSALHIPGHLSKAAVSIVTPDLSQVDESIQSDLTELQKNLTARNSSFDLESFVLQWNRMKELRSERQVLETRRSEVTQKMRQTELNAIKPSTESPSVEDIKQEGIKLRNQMKELTKAWYEIEEIAVTRALSLPNKLHPKTPIEVSQSTTPFIPSNPNATSRCKTNDVKFVDHSPSAFYLRGQSARLELEWMRMFSNDWIQSGYDPISAPDFVRSLIVDGCGLPFNDPNQVLSLAAIHDHGGNLESGNGLHLVGGASLAAMVAFLAKTMIQEPFPLRLVSTGRCYHPPGAEKNPSNDLSFTTQSSSIQLLTAMTNCPDAMFKELMFIQERIHQQLTQLNLQFRTTTLCARHLQPWEQYRSAIEAYSPLLEKYVEVANISIIGDFISRRLAIYGPGKEVPGFVSSQALSVARLLACNIC